MLSGEREKRKGNNYSLRKNIVHIRCQWAANTVTAVGTSRIFWTKGVQYRLPGVVLCGYGAQILNERANTGHENWFLPQVCHVWIQPWLKTVLWNKNNHPRGALLNQWLKLSSKLSFVHPRCAGVAAEKGSKHLGPSVMSGEVAYPQGTVQSHLVLAQICTLWFCFLHFLWKLKLREN